MNIIIPNKYEKIEQLTQSGYTVEATKYISEAFEIFKKYPWGFIGFSIIIGLLSGGSRVIPMHMGTGISIVIGAPLNIGIAIVARKIKYGESFSFGDFFGGFNKFIELFLGNLLMAVMVILGFICLIIPGIYLAVSYVFVTMLIWFLFDGSYWTTLERSRKLVAREWFSFFVFFLLILLLNLAGLICFGIGLLVTIPVSGISMYVCYESLIGTDDGTATENTITA